MIKSQFVSALALAAFLAVPAFAQTDSNSRTVDGATVEARVSTLPTLHGEKAVIRILPRSDNIPRLDKTGLSGAQLELLTNDANNYLLSTIVEKLTTAVHASVAKEVGAETANQLLTGFGTIHTQMVKAADGRWQIVAAQD